MFKAELIRYIKAPLNVVYSFFFPIILLIIFGFTFQGENKVLGISSAISTITFFNALAITLMPMSSNIFLDKYDKRIKQYLIIKGAFWKYLGSIFLINFMIYLANTTLLFLIGILAFNVELSWQAWLMLIFIDLILFVIGFMLAIIIASYSTSMTKATSAGLISFFVLSLLSGATYPWHYSLKEYFYIEAWSPLGQMVLLFNYVGWNNFINLQTWQLGLTIAMFIGSCAGIYWVFTRSIKNFKK